MYLEELKNQKEYNESILLKKATELAQELATKVYETSNNYLTGNPLFDETLCKFLGACQSITNELNEKGLIVKRKSTINFEDFKSYFYRYYDANLVISPIVDNYYTIGVGIGFNQAIHIILFEIEIHTFDLLTTEDKQQMYLVSNCRSIL